MSYVSGYYQKPVMPRAYGSGQGAVSALGVENYPKTAAEIATVARPTVPGAIAGLSGNVAAARARGFFAKADRVRRFGSRVQATRAGREVLARGIASGIKQSILFGGLCSLVANGYSVYKGEQTMAKGGSAVVGDVAATAAAGTAASVLSTAGTSMLATSLGTGFGLTLAGLGIGVLSFMAVDYLVRQTAFHQHLVAASERMIAQVVE